MTTMTNMKKLDNQNLEAVNGGYVYFEDNRWCVLRDDNGQVITAFDNTDAGLKKAREYCKEHGLSNAALWECMVEDLRTRALFGY